VTWSEAEEGGEGEGEEKISNLYFLMLQHLPCNIFHVIPAGFNSFLACLHASV
jgi:hypothetical protein